LVIHGSVGLDSRFISAYLYPYQWIYKFTLDKGAVSYLNAHQWACCTSLMTMSGVTMNRDGGHVGSEIVVVAN
jgi:hypothetical protein